MKRIIILCIFLLCFYIIYDVSKDEEKDKNKEEIRVIFISYIELKKYINGKSGDEVKNNILDEIEQQRNYYKRINPGDKNYRYLNFIRILIF